MTRREKRESETKRESRDRTRVTSREISVRGREIVTGKETRERETSGERRGRETVHSTQDMGRQ